MIIKEIKIKNFRSYYGDNNKFEFSDGLTLILGDNGDGKTTFFEALQWLFNTTIDNGNIDNMSEMRKSKLEIGESDVVSVYMAFEHDGLKSVEKSFTVERTGELTYKTSKLTYTGYETNKSERVQVSGKLLIDRCYDAFIQRFSMFKGESELNVFDNAAALKSLVDKFSDIRKFDDLVAHTNVFAENANKAYLKEIKSDKKVANQAKILESSISQTKTSIQDKIRERNEKENSLNTYTKKLGELEDNQETSKTYKDLQSRLKTQKEKATKLRSQIMSVDYNHALLDRMWILCAFPSILQQFKQKCSAFSKEKRKQEKAYEAQKNIELGKLEAIKEMQGALVNGAAELPWYLPNQETMEEMINDHICKVCGRTAEEGTEAYHFMVHKLEEYKRHIQLEAEQKTQEQLIKEKELFKTEHIESLHNLSISLSGSSESKVAGIASEIFDRRDLVERLSRDLADIEEKIKEIEDEKTRLLIQAGNVSESDMEKDFNDIKGLFEQQGRAKLRIQQLDVELGTLTIQLEDLQKQLGELNPEGIQVKVYCQINQAMAEIAKAFTSAKTENLRRFLSEMEDKANEYLQKLSASDFHGEIRLIQTANESTQIKLYSSNGSEIKKPSGSQRTVMYISVLFAISDFTQEKRSEDYPLIFDAATSSFGDSKEDEFYNVIDGIQKQCIIVTKDFMNKGIVRNTDIEKLSCPVYRIKKAEGFDPKNMATIRTTIVKLKD